MLSTTQKLDDATVSAVMASKPFSRLPVSHLHFLHSAHLAEFGPPSQRRARATARTFCSSWSAQ